MDRQKQINMPKDVIVNMELEKRKEDILYKYLWNMIYYKIKSAI